MSSPSQEQQNEDGSGAAVASGEGGEEVAVAMDTTTATTPTPTIEEDEDTEPTTWDLAREASKTMVVHSVLDDMENRAAKQKEELQQVRRRAEDAESSLRASWETIAGLEANVRSETERKDGFSKTIRETSRELAIAKESADTEKERADRSQAESDRLREEIRCVAIRFIIVLCCMMETNPFSILER